jgi:hypothetical protein
LMLQEFLKVFETLRDEIVNDELLAGQPDSSKQWVKEVRWRRGGQQRQRRRRRQWRGQDRRLATPAPAAAWRPLPLSLHKTSAP